MVERSINYPLREQLFVLRFLRLLTSAGIANELSGDANSFLLKIALLEDQKRYSSAPNFYNSQFCELFGWSVDKLNRIRQECTNKGWLVYHKGGKGIAGIYFVTVPEKYLELAESVFNLSPQECGYKRESDGIYIRKSAEESRGKAEGKHRSSMPMSYNLNPIKEKASDKKPSGEIINEDQLLRFIEEWHKWVDEGIVNQRCNLPPGKQLTGNWNSVQRNPNYRKYFEDIPGMMEQAAIRIRGDDFKRNAEWLTIYWLLKTKQDDLNLNRVATGRIKNANEQSRQQSGAARQEAGIANAFEQFEEQVSGVQKSVSRPLLT